MQAPGDASKDLGEIGPFGSYLNHSLLKLNCPRRDEGWFTTLI